MEYEDLVCDFAKRTIKNYDSYIGEYKVTELINSSLGLFVFTEQKFFCKITDDIISPEILNELKLACTSSYIEELNLQNICKHMRNGIAHFRIEIIADNRKEIHSVKIRDVCGGKQFTVCLNVELMEKFFREFAKSIISKHRRM